MSDSLHVFISYAHADHDRVLMLAERLRAGAFDVYLDKWKLAPGDTVSAELERAIHTADAGIVVFSTVSVSRPWVLEEYYTLLGRAVTGRGRLIPVVLDDVELPAFAGNRLAVELPATSGAHWDAAFDSIVRGLRKRRS